ncbi:ABC transporter ATP-binding protein [Photobacterium kasasachensis]|uniref:ABC transporter ATP-binding protein n=1 Tax=Photobacterium kasasachensis TaxID=2910240 RepID=UPI003D148CF5
MNVLLKNFRTISALLWPELRKSKLFILLSTISVFLCMVSSFSIAFTIENNISSIEVNLNDSGVNFFALEVLGLIFSLALFTGIKEYSVSQLQLKTCSSLYGQLSKSILRNELVYFDLNSPSKIQSSMEFDIRHVKEFIHFVFSIATQSTMTIVIGSIYMMSVSTKLFALAVILVPMVIFVIFYSSYRVSSALKKTKLAQTSFDSFVVESYSAIQSIKLLHLYRIIDARLEKRIRHLVEANSKVKVLESITSTIFLLLTFSAVLLVVWMGMIHIQQGEVSSGELISFVMVMLMVSYSVAAIHDIASIFCKMAQSAKSITGIIRNEKLVIENLPGHEDINSGSEISIESVSFSYPNSNYHQVLKDISITISAKSCTAIVGRSGSGKSTLVKLLGRLYDPHQGRITIGGTDIMLMRKSTVRRSVTIVEQDPFIFDATLEQNIILSNTEGDLSRLKNSIELSGLDRVLANKGIKLTDTIGRNGATLSGGERQRLAIARALYSNSEIIIFDESTNALDNITDKVIRNTMDRLKSSHTIIIVSHKMHTLIDADKIIVIDDGYIKDSGTHKELVGRSETYNKLCYV